MSFFIQYYLPIALIVILAGIFLRDRGEWLRGQLRKASTVPKKASRFRKLLARIVDFLLRARVTVFLGRLLLEALTLVFGLSIVAIALWVFIQVFPPLVSQIGKYHDKILELAAIPITASSIFTGFALTVPTIKGHQEDPTIHWVKLFGVICVLLSLLAVLAYDNYWWQTLLALAILSLFLQALAIAWRLL